LILRSRFFWKLYTPYAALILLSTVLFGMRISRSLEEDANHEIRQSLEARARLLKVLAKDSLESPPPASFQPRIRALGEQIGTRLTVIKADGTVIADSDERPVGMDNHGERPEILEAHSQDIGTAQRFSNTLGTRMMYLALAVKTEGRLLGYVRTSLPLSVIDRWLGRLHRAIALGAGASALAALFLGLLLTRHFIKPLASMTRVAEAMSQGDYQQRLPATRRDEIGQLAQAFNRMAGSCQLRTDIINADRNKLSAILSGMSEGVVAVDRQERLIHLNEAAGRLLEVPPKEHVGKTLWQLTRIREVPEILSAALRGEGERQARLQLAAFKKDRYIDVTASPLHDAQGKIRGAVAMMKDVSAHYQLETVRRDFVANASHELKTPITAIRGLVETLIDDTALPEATRARFLEKIRNQSLRLSSLVNDLLALSRLESGRQTQEALPLDLRELLLDAAKTFASVGEEQGIALEVQVAESPIEVLGDEEALSQLVDNLLDNALKYTLRGGSVSARLSQQDSQACISVKDTGIGIAPKDLERIFERFYRVDKARSRALGGTGLGLSIVKHIALVHGGHVSVESRPGQGSIFRVFLPLSAQEGKTKGSEDRPSRT